MADSKATYKLNLEQQKLVENNHNLIYDYLNKYNLAFDEYYDILALGLCKAALLYEKDKGAFSTFAYYWMKHEMLSYYHKLNKKSVIPQNMELALDGILNKDNRDGEMGEAFFKNPLTGYATDKLQLLTEDIVVGRLVIDDIKDSLLNKNENFVVDCIIKDLTHKEIANMLGCTRENVTYYVVQIRKKLLKYYNK